MSVRTVTLELQSLTLDDLGGSPWVEPLAVARSRLPPVSDVVVVGSGITGLSAALALAERHVSVTIVDRAVGGGATSRSGGIVLGDTLVGPAPDFDRCDRALVSWIQHHEVACDLDVTNCRELTRDPDVTGLSTGWCDGGLLRVAHAIPGALVEPVKLLNALLTAAVARGVEVIDRVRVEALEPGVNVCLRRLDRIDNDETRRASVRAADVILAVDAAAWGTTINPWPERCLTVALQTVVVKGLASTIRMTHPFYTRELPLLWGRPLPDGSLVFGRELIPWPGTSGRGTLQAAIAEAGRRLTARVRGLHPALANVEVQRVWAGPTARSRDGVPHIVPDPDLDGVVWAGGYGGHGLAQAFTLGQYAASYVLQRRRER